LSFLWKKKRLIIDKIKTYLEQVDTCRDLFHKSMKELIISKSNKEDEESVQLVHKAESRADDIRREIELDLYQKALIPESRGDVLGLLETIPYILF